MLKVYNGMTGAGCRQPLKEPHKGWECKNGHANAGYSRRCLTEGCNVWRPDCTPRPSE